MLEKLNVAEPGTIAAIIIFIGVIVLFIVLLKNHDWSIKKLWPKL